MRTRVALGVHSSERAAVLNRSALGFPIWWVFSSNAPGSSKQVGNRVCEEASEQPTSKREACEAMRDGGQSAKAGKKNKTRQGKARRRKAGQGKARQGKARQGKARRGEARRGEARRGKARQGKARRDNSGTDFA